MTVALSEGCPDFLRSVIFEFAAPLPFMFAGAWSPLTDFYGQELQHGYSDELLEQFFVSSFAGTTSAMICISWRDVDGAPAKVIAQQINALSADQKASACLQFVMKHVENVFFNPDWHTGLNDKQREQLTQLAESGMDGSPPLTPIRLDVDFHLPTVSRSFQV